MGIGKRLIDYLVKEAKQKKFYKVVLNCEEKNIFFYRKSGFQETEEIKMKMDFKNVLK